MLLVTSSAALGAIMCVVFGAWAFGRLQGGFADAQASPDADPSRFAHVGKLAESHEVPAVAAPSPLVERADWRGTIGDPASLGELHAEISAYRRAERVFAGIDSEDFALKPLLNREPRGLASTMEKARAVSEAERQASARIEPCATVPPQTAGAV